MSTNEIDPFLGLTKDVRGEHCKIEIDASLLDNKIKTSRSRSLSLFHQSIHQSNQCLVVAKEEKVLEKVARSVSARHTKKICKGSRNPQSVVLLAVVVWNESPAWFMMKREDAFANSFRVSSMTQSRIASTPDERPSQRWMSCMRWRDKAKPFTASVVERYSNWNYVCSRLLDLAALSFIRPQVFFNTTNQLTTFKNRQNIPFRHCQVYFSFYAFFFLGPAHILRVEPPAAPSWPRMLLKSRIDSKEKSIHSLEFLLHF